MVTTSAAPFQVSFLLVPDFSMIAFTCAMEPLRMANLISDRSLYQWSTVSLGGEPVQASNGLRIVPDMALESLSGPSLLVVCGGLHIQRHCSRGLIQGIRKLTSRRLALGAICTGSYVLARAELLNGYRSTIHWENMASMREDFPHLVISNELFEIDRDRYTCSGGTAPLDMMLHLIGAQQSQGLASAISETFICERIRTRHDRQRIPLRLRLGTSQPKLVEAVSLMEANLEEPMSPDELAKHVGLSRRQLERLFQKYLNCVPTRYYLELRLARARQLLLQTTMSIVDVAFACGFVSAPHFSKCYRDFFGIPPRDERRRRQSTATAATAAAIPAADDAAASYGSD